MVLSSMNMRQGMKMMSEIYPINPDIYAIENISRHDLYISHPPHSECSMEGRHFTMECRLVRVTLMLDNGKYKGFIRMTIIK